ncbi:hypothetical protein D3C73_1183950 [compost metagenome]
MERARVAGFVFVQAAQNARLLNTQAFGSALYELYKTHDLYLYCSYVFRNGTVRYRTLVTKGAPKRKTGQEC